MKKLSLCIGVFAVLFLMMDLYTAQAQGNLTEYNGLWLKDVSKYRNMVWGGLAGSETIPVKGRNETYTTYTCMSVDPATPGTINLRTYGKDGTDLKISGFLWWHSGTDREFLADMELVSDDNLEYNTAYVTVSYDRFTAVPGFGYYSGEDYFDTWDFVWKATIPRRIPAAVFDKGCGFVTNGT
jgi:hypothetical protein